jgi:hypothetical protein
VILLAFRAGQINELKYRKRREGVRCFNGIFDQFFAAIVNIEFKELLGFAEDTFIQPRMPGRKSRAEEKQY